MEDENECWRTGQILFALGQRCAELVAVQTRLLGKTGLQVPILSFGASSLGQEFRSVTLDEAVKSVRVALDCGLNFIDTSPFYGRGMSEVLLGVALKGVPRDSYTLCTKLGRYDLQHFDFSARRVAESVDVSLHRLGTDHIDIMLCHDIEFVKMQQIVDETIPAMRKTQQQGKVRLLGFSGYPMKIFRFILDRTDVDVALSYNQYTLQNTHFADEIVPMLKQRGIGAMNAGPFSARLLTNAPLPKWLKEPDEVKAAARAAAEHCAKKGVDIAKLALQFSCANPDIATTIAGSANPENIRKWAKWIEEPLDDQLLREVQEILRPVKNIGHKEGLPENN
jgi:aryl-alcohol dehydrogenase-like predicted oxidoreductase